MTINDYLRVNHITLTELSEHVKCSISYLSKIKHNAIRPNKRVKTELELLGISIPLKDINTLTQAKNEYIAKLQAENKELREANKRLKQFINNRLNQAIDFIIQAHCKIRRKN